MITVSQRCEQGGCLLLPPCIPLLTFFDSLHFDHIKDDDDTDFDDDEC